MNLKILFLGVRPKTLGAAIVPPVVALSYARSQGIQFNWIIINCLMLALFLQVATNFYNDAIDKLKGADEKRVGPQRLGAQFNIDPKKIMLIGHIFMALAFIFAVPIFIKGGPIFIILGLISAFLAYGYTGGPFPLAYLGLGEVFVFIFFGWVATLGSFYLMAGNLDIYIWFIASMVGFLSMTLIGINNFRDREGDADVGKRTLATRLSSKSYLALLDCFLFLPFILTLYLVISLKESYLILLLIAGLTHRIRFILRNYQKPMELNDALALAGKQLVLFAFLFWLGSLWQSNI
ncbi:MAG: 1,4-dihydroxy-2-naphthoate octaprenyltransferase [Halobacteriovoraceae bacterium]|nr:1,4-dihydroxy-2-naphthoate octaprenyltransferase [Halobacteriovoraceae bacterium]